MRDQEMDGREIAAAMLNNGEALDRLQKAEVHLRRAYNRTWDRLERMQKERRKMPLNEALKQSQIWATYEAQRNNCSEHTGESVVRDQEMEAIRNNRPQDIPQRHPDLDEKGNLKTYPEGHPLYRPKNDSNKDPDSSDSTGPAR